MFFTTMHIRYTHSVFARLICVRNIFVKSVNWETDYNQQFRRKEVSINQTEEFFHERWTELVVTDENVSL